MKDKRLSIVLLVILCLVPACRKETSKGKKILDPSLAKILVKQELVIGVDPSIPPLSFYASTGKIIGYEIDVAHELAKRLGVNLKIVPIAADNRMTKLKNGTIDYIASGFIDNKENQQKFSLSQPYVRDALVTIVFESITGDTPFKEFSDLHNKRVGVVSVPEIIEVVVQSPLYKNNQHNLSAYPRLEKLLIALDYGQLDAAVINLLTYYSKITKEKRPYRIIGEPLIIHSYSYAFRKEDQELCAAIDTILNELAADLTLTSIAQKWFGADVSIIGKY